VWDRRSLDSKDICTWSVFSFDEHSIESAGAQKSVSQGSMNIINLDTHLIPYNAVLQ
jgi:hypothetical protein